MQQNCPYGTLWSNISSVCIANIGYYRPVYLPSTATALACIDNHLMGATSCERGLKVFIDGIQPDKKLRISEVDLYRGDIRINPFEVLFILSSNTESLPNCFDKDRKSFCFTDPLDKFPYLAMEIGTRSFDRVAVRTEEEYLSGSSFSVVSADGAPLLQSTFDSSTSSYIFGNLMGPTLYGRHMTRGTLCVCFPRGHKIIISNPHPYERVGPDMFRRVIHLAEIIVAFGGNPIEHNLLDFTLSHTMYNNTPSLCNDGKLGSFCHTSVDDPQPILTIDVGTHPFDAIKVWNRLDCCQEKIRGASIKVVTYSGEIVWESKFDDETWHQEYLFRIQLPCYSDERLTGRIEQIERVPEELPFHRSLTVSLHGFGVPYHGTGGIQVIDIAEVTVFFAGRPVLLTPSAATFRHRTISNAQFYGAIECIDNNRSVSCMMERRQHSAMPHSCNMEEGAACTSEDGSTFGSMVELSIDIGTAPFDKVVVYPVYPSLSEEQHGLASKSSKSTLASIQAAMEHASISIEDHDGQVVWASKLHSGESTGEAKAVPYFHFILTEQCCPRGQYYASGGCLDVPTHSFRAHGSPLEIAPPAISNTLYFCKHALMPGAASCPIDYYSTSLSTDSLPAKKTKKKSKKKKKSSKTKPENLGSISKIIPCIPGFYFDPISSTCELVPAGYYNPHTNSTLYYYCYRSILPGAASCNQVNMNILDLFITRTDQFLISILIFIFTRFLCCCGVGRCWCMQGWPV